ncbi:protein kinase regulator [Moniliophthora roreri MCA 2997]|uniref:Protein kinase regulator n=1 Tax=Moniliophthora roreri (strain MCA 2997) TaxID=1381753 RepID=V2Z160_MONRO|nr:protein kinase regulator [Moniliophthora roreri MCA 2997]
MAMDRNLMDWDEADVHKWLTSIGYAQYETNIKEHRISGDILCMLDQETLKGVGVSTVGQRLAILKAVYNLKIQYNIPIDSDSYVPPSEAQEKAQELTVERLHSMLSDQAQRLRVLEEENKILNSTLQSFLDDYNSLRSSLSSPPQDASSPPLRRQHSFKWAQYVKPNKSPTKPISDSNDSPHPSPQQLEHDIPPYTRQTPRQPPQAPPPLPPPPASSSSTNTATDSSPTPTAITPTPKPTATRQDSSDNLKSFKVSLEDPTYKVLPAALKKYRINNDNWENYAMFICYGSPGNRIERCLSYDEKPLLLFQKLKDAKKNPVFMLKHIKDIRSPIVVAQQKHAARKASSTISAGDQAPSNTATTTTTSATTTTQKSTHTPSRSITRPPKLEVHDLSNNVPSGLHSAAPISGSGNGAWPDVGVGSPVNEQQPGLATPNPNTSAPTQTPNSAATATPTSNPNPNSNTSTRDPLPTTSPSPGTISYAVAIYPYMAEQADEFDVVVGDTFIILSRARGWWVVQRDPEGTGVLSDSTTAAASEGEENAGKQGWVPAGCLLETMKPVAVAIREAREARGGSVSEEVDSGGGDGKNPILPLSIISTSFPGIALMDYKKKGEEELDLVKDDTLRVFKRYNHWSYAVKEDGGDRGWVPSWFIGKVANTYNQGSMSNSGLSTHLDSSETAPPQVSPMSSAFPVR